MTATACFYSTPEDLVIEHFQGRCRGLLNAALAFLSGRTVEDFGDGEEFEEAGNDCGFSDAELAAADMIQRGDYMLPSDPRGVAFSDK